MRFTREQLSVITVLAYSLTYYYSHVLSLVPEVEDAQPHSKLLAPTHKIRRLGTHVKHPRSVELQIAEKSM